ncbi:MAG: NUDIX domain-containing protein [Thermoplasmatota archaeon]
MTSGPTSATRPNAPKVPDGPEYTVIVVTRQAKDGSGDEFLLVRHRDRGWELPGGKLEGLEGPVHCALREFREETGHLIAGPRFVAKLRKDNGTCYLFSGGLGPQVQEVVADEAIEEMAWHRRLPVDGLSFPDDPYDVIGDHLGFRLQ